MEIGSLVAPKSDRDPLVSGASWYDCAIVASIKPFILISEAGDMSWQATVKAEQFDEVGKASAETARNALDRLARDVPLSKSLEAGAADVLRAIATTAGYRR